MKISNTILKTRIEFSLIKYLSSRDWNIAEIWSIFIGVKTYCEGQTPSFVSFLLEKQEKREELFLFDFSYIFWIRGLEMKIATVQH